MFLRENFSMISNPTAPNPGTTARASPVRLATPARRNRYACRNSSFARWAFPPDSTGRTMRLSGRLVGSDLERLENAAGAMDRSGSGLGLWLGCVLLAVSDLYCSAIACRQPLAAICQHQFG